jgi:hypothetical protein
MDIISSIPYTYIFVTMLDEDNFHSPGSDLSLGHYVYAKGKSLIKIVKILRILRILKVLRVLKV